MEIIVGGILGVFILVAILLAVLGFRQEEGEFFAGSVIVLIITAVIIGVTSDVVNGNEAKRQCLKDGKSVIVIENIKLCKL
jgi:UDP-N-acetylmuramyl pentapeptide phosphotransferase/UDP-N-acetylglucosamine-1-phosphate transferase